jgi:uroporphyrin-III C-methyltransferase/precorrin-2 dehydrogenase/sirohydrochlorin ferrochelatase
MNNLYPIFLQLQGRPCTVIGGGDVAFRKVRGLLDAGARVTVVSPALAPGLARLRDDGAIRWIPRRYLRGDLAGAFLAFSAADDPAASEDATDEAEERGIPLNTADRQDLSSFHLPAVVARGDIKAAISTGGKSPALAAELKERLDAVIGEDEADFAAVLGDLRARARTRFPDPARRTKVLKALAKSMRLPDIFRARRGKAYIVGAGPGDPRLLTRRAFDLIRTADEVHHDRLVGPGILDLIPDSVRRIFVGKVLGDEGRPDTGELLVEAARAGRAVVRLKGGDPGVFGKTGEEILALLRAGIPFEIVPGVSALTAAPAAAGFPLTLRGVADEVVIRTGQRAPGHLPSGRTIVWFMGVSRLGDLVAEAVADGLDPSTPSAIVERATLPGGRVLIAPLADLEERAKRAGIEAPALVIAGEAVRLAGPVKDLETIFARAGAGAFLEDLA